MLYDENRFILSKYFQNWLMQPTAIHTTFKLLIWRKYVFALILVVQANAGEIPPVAFV
jgi:hypothetical protein